MNNRTLVLISLPIIISTNSSSFLNQNFTSEFPDVVFLLDNCYFDLFDKLLWDFVQITLVALYFYSKKRRSRTLINGQLTSKTTLLIENHGWKDKSIFSLGGKIYWVHVFLDKKHYLFENFASFCLWNVLILMITSSDYDKAQRETVVQKAAEMYIFEIPYYLV